MPSPKRPLLALTLLSIAATAGCAEWKALLDDALSGQDGAGKSGGTATGAGGSLGSDAGASLTCDAVSKADGTVCKRCVDASGAVVREDCPPSSSGAGTGGSTGSSTGTAGSTGGSCIKIDGGGGPSSCKDAATWKQYGADACAQQNLVLSDIVYGAACGANFQDATYVCCGGTTGSGGASGGATTCDAYTNAAGAVCKRCVDASGAVVTDECPQPPPPQPPTTCTKINDGGPSSCKDAATWKQYGAATCAGMGLTLSDIAYGTPCGANFQDVVYVCCGTVAPSCSVNVDALGNSCTTCWDATGAVVKSECQSSGVTCQTSTGADGATCKTCTYPDGRIFSAECSGGSSGGTEICDLETNADGVMCKVCYEPDGTTISSCP